jgi:sulfide:quinone oxidoreductase
LLDVGSVLPQRQHAVAEPFGVAPAPDIDIAAIAAEHAAGVRIDQLASVEPDMRRVHTVRGDTLEYDALLVAVGASPAVAVPGALTFTGSRDVAAFGQLLEDLVAGRIKRVAFAVPASVTWTLPLYELAFMAGEYARAKRLEVGLVLATPERTPLEAFAPRIGSQIWSLLAERGIAMRASSVPVRAGAGGLVVAHARNVQVHRTVSLPRLGGPWISGLPHDAEGFIVTDQYGAVPGAQAVWAAGDATAFPIKQGGIAAQQADAAAASLAAFLGADVVPEPFRPVLRGMLLDPRGAVFLDARRGDAPRTPLWWPPTKVAAQHLSRCLTPGIPSGEPVAEELDVGELLLKLADRHAALGEDALALRCLRAAQQVRGELPPQAAARRDQLAGVHNGG